MKKPTEKKPKPEPEKSFTISEIETLYKAYKAKTGLRILKNGTWVYKFDVKSLKNIDGVRAESVQLSSVMPFPKYLRMIK